MCGIVGAVGHKQCGSVLLDALKRLEYRGYDSSGIVTIDDGKIALKRAPRRASPQTRRRAQRSLSFRAAPSLEARVYH